MTLTILIITDVYILSTFEFLSTDLTTVLYTLVKVFRHCSLYIHRRSIADILPPLNQNRSEGRYDYPCHSYILLFYRIYLQRLGISLHYTYQLRRNYQSSFLLPLSFLHSLLPCIGSFLLSNSLPGHILNHTFIPVFIFNRFGILVLMLAMLSHLYIPQEMFVSRTNLFGFWSSSNQSGQKVKRTNS